MVFFAWCFCYAVIIVALYRIQIVYYSFYAELGRRQYVVTMTSLPPRGLIYDRTGRTLLATNKDCLSAFIVPNQLDNKAELLEFLALHYPHAAKELSLHEKSHFMYIARNLDADHITCIEKANIADIHFLKEPNRFYPIPSAGTLVGVTDIDNKGITGIELLYNDLLAGEPSTYFLEHDARSGNFYFKKKMMHAGKDGRDVHLTIDGTIQFLVSEELKTTVAACHAREGSVIVMNPKNGHIIAMVTVPDFDPNNRKNMQPEHMNSSIVTQEFELGSVMKVISALAALQEGVVTMDDLIDCEKVVTTYIDGRRVNTVKSSVAGVIPFYDVIAKSNNIGIAKVVKKMGPRLYDHYMRLGFGKKTGIQFPGERAGFVNKPEHWSKQSIFSLAYGYEMTATLLQLAQAFAIIANNGQLVRPTLLMPSSLDGAQTTSLDKKDQSELFAGKPLYSPDSIQSIRAMLEHTVLQGSARRARIEGYTIMSKTGTANILENGVYNKDRNIYTCAGIIEKGDYQRVIVTFIKECAQKNLYASTVAVPLFEKVASKILIHDKIL
jgi:cell division protein FtsI/penicillin-binding protein 2